MKKFSKERVKIKNTGHYNFTHLDDALLIRDVSNHKCFSVRSKKR